MDTFLAAAQDNDWIVTGNELRKHDWTLRKYIVNFDVHSVNVFVGGFQAWRDRRYVK